MAARLEPKSFANLRLIILNDKGENRSTDRTPGRIKLNKAAPLKDGSSFGASMEYLAFAENVALE